jgi:hypothetical protein
MVYSMTAIEVTLNYNNVTGVLFESGDGLRSFGQILPALIGGAGFVRILWIMATAYFEVRLINTILEVPVMFKF